MQSNQSIRWVLIATIILEYLVPRGTFAGVSRVQEADSFISSDKTKSWSLPATTDTLVGLAASGVLTNKSISGSTNTLTNLPTSALSGQVAIANGGTNATTAVTALQNLGAETVFNGVENAALISLGYVASTRTLSITYSSGAAILCGGIRYPQSAGVVTISHAATNGLWYFYYDTSGTLNASQTVWNPFLAAPIATVYYNTSNAGGAADGILSYELHAGGANGMSPATHWNLHTTRGTQILSGIIASGYTLNSSGLANVSYALSAGSIADEDIVLSTAAQAKGGANTYRILYQTGTTANPVWNWVDNAEGGIYSNGTNIYYNQLTGGNWQLTANAAGGTTYQNYWVLATTANNTPQVVVIMGSATYASQALATAATFSTEIPNIGLFTAEGVVVYQMTYSRNSGYGAPGNARLVAATRVTQSIVTIATGSGTVTSVGLADDTGLFNIIGSPVVASGTLTLGSFKSQSANTFLAAPNGSSGAPTFRQLVAADVPGFPVGINQVQDVFYGGGNTATYTLSYAPTLAAEVLCHIDGLSLIQGATKDYTVTIGGPTVTLTSNLGVGQSLMCYYNKN